ncbi:MAG: NifB/NifX family molybdenum-iron cluster-binding protein [Desulfovermiculus sp.]
MPQVALTVWGSRISPVYEGASQIRLVQINDMQTARMSDMPLSPDPVHRIGMFREHGVEVLICGAISGLQASIIRACEITLFPFVTGEVSEVLTAYMHGKLDSVQFTMPGCFGRQRHRRRRGRKA